MSTEISALVGKLTGAKPEDFRVLVGFDGYIDELLRVVKQGTSPADFEFFPTITAFSQRIGEAAGKSADLELVSTEVKLGGNAPILANALTELGVNTTCIGAMGRPELHAVFQDMARRCECISLCDSAYTTALEFDDGKIMLANCKPLEGLNWENLKKLVGLEELIRRFSGSAWIALVNWGGVAGTGGIWDGILQEVLPALSGKDRCFFFDLADPSKRSAEQIRGALEQIRGFLPYGKVYLGMNENEALRVSAAVGQAADTAEEACRALYELLQLDAVVVHPLNRSIAATKFGMVTEMGKVVAHPVISTGGGDNFNAGFCTGLLLGCDIQQCLLLGMGTSGYYVGNGHSPTLEELPSHMEKWIKL